MSIDNLREKIIVYKALDVSEIENMIKEFVQTYNKEIERLKAEIEKLKKENYFLKYNKNAL